MDLCFNPEAHSCSHTGCVRYAAPYQGSCTTRSERCRVVFLSRHPKSAPSYGLDIIPTSAPQKGRHTRFITHSPGSQGGKHLLQTVSRYFFFATPDHLWLGREALRPSVSKMPSFELAHSQRSDYTTQDTTVNENESRTLTQQCIEGRYVRTANSRIQRSWVCSIRQFGRLQSARPPKPEASVRESPNHVVACTHITAIGTLGRDTLYTHRIVLYLRSSIHRS